MFKLPLKDESIDIMYTVHSVEPNGRHEREILSELYRVTNEYLILLEPAYEFANNRAKQRMIEHGYVTELYSAAKDLGLKILTWELYDKNAVDALNPTGIMIIEKSAHAHEVAPLCCPVTKTSLKKIGNAYFSPESLLAYPILDDVPCLAEDYAIVATKMDGFYGDKPWEALHK